jgi:hypothetical protein
MDFVGFSGTQQFYTISAELVQATEFYVVRYAKKKQALASDDEAGPSTANVSLSGR